jgi:EAL domain-containing protein (putative c-di-GMP-specific phosphodiesterase class I)
MQWRVGWQQAARRNPMRLSRPAQWQWEQDAALRFSHIDGSTAAAAQFASAFAGKHWTDLQCAARDPADWLRHQLLLDAHEPFFNLVLELPQNDGTRLWIELSGVPVLNAEGFHGYRGVGRDVSAHKASEAALTTQPATPHSPDAARHLGPPHASPIERALAQALANDQLRVFYQPIVDLKRQVIGYEALLRWQHPQLGLVGPDAFISLAEQTGLIVPIGEWMIAAACRQLLAFDADPARSACTIAVNLSARQLAQPDLVDHIKALLTRSGAVASRLKLEITESMLLTDIGKTTEKLHALTALGIRLSLDDFGTGYSSLSYLKKLPLSQLKIDQSFVRELLSDPVDAAIVKTILQLARSLGMTVIAEGVELEGQCKVLADMGCREFQGFLFGKPKPFD